MKVTDGMTEMAGMPHIEAKNVIDAMEAAEAAGDLKALRWAARFITWLYGQGEAYDSGMFCNAEKLFNEAYAAKLKSDPPPESIAKFIIRQGEPETPTDADAQAALDDAGDNAMKEVKPIMELAAEMIGGQSNSLPVNTIAFYPAERVREIFQRLKAAKRTDREAAETRIFAERMIFLYEAQSEESNTFLDFDEAGRLAAYGEAMADAVRTAKMEAKAAYV